MEDREIPSHLTLTPLITKYERKERKVEKPKKIEKNEKNEKNEIPIKKIEPVSLWSDSDKKLKLSREEYEKIENNHKQRIKELIIREKVRIDSTIEIKKLFNTICK